MYSSYFPIFFRWWSNSYGDKLKEKAIKKVNFVGIASHLQLQQPHLEEQKPTSILIDLVWWKLILSLFVVMVENCGLELIVTTTSGCDGLRSHNLASYNPCASMALEVAVEGSDGTSGGRSGEQWWSQWWLQWRAVIIGDLRWWLQWRQVVVVVLLQ